MLNRLSVRRVEFGARSRGTESNFSALEIGDIDEAEVSGGITGGLVKSGSKGCAFGDLVELLWVIVVKKNMKAKDVLDDRKRMFGCEGGHSPIVEDKASDCLSAVDLIGQLRLGEEAVVRRVFRKTFENGSNIVGIG